MMFRVTKIIVVTLLLALPFVSVSGAGSALLSQEVLATNSWTAAFARAAGVESISQLAPSNMLHPPEYELKASDVKKIREAALLIYAGYEVLMKTVFDSFDKDEGTMLKIVTSYNPKLVRRAVMTIGQKAGNPAKAAAFADAYDVRMAAAVSRLKDKGHYGKSVLVHFHQQALIRALGFNVLAVFGPAPLTAGDLRALGKQAPDLIVDNGHNPMAGPIAEITGAPVIALVNFPGGSDEAGNPVPATLDGVLSYNTDRLFSILEK